MGILEDQLFVSKIVIFHFLVGVSNHLGMAKTLW